MLIKVLKYDFFFSKTTFFSIAALMISLAVILRFTELAFVDSFPASWINTILISVIVVVSLAFIGQIVQFFYKNFFGDTGYLMLTLPVGRFTLLGSKLIVSFVWLTFMLLTAVIMSYILLFSQAQDAPSSLRTSGINVYDILTLLQVYLIAMFFVTMLFLVITLAHSTGRWRVTPLFASIFGIMYTALFFASAELLGLRHWYPENAIARPGGWFTTGGGFSMVQYYANGGYSYANSEWTDRFVFSRPILGLNIGRIPIGDQGYFLDIYIIAMALAFCTLSIILTYWLLKKRANLD